MVRRRVAAFVLLAMASGPALAARGDVPIDGPYRVHSYVVQEFASGWMGFPTVVRVSYTVGLNGRVLYRRSSPIAGIPDLATIMRAFRADERAACIDASASAGDADVDLVTEDIDPLGLRQITGRHQYRCRSIYQF